MRRMWLIPICLGLVFLLAGCSRTIYPGDGRLVIVEIDQDMDNCPIGNATVGAAVRAGIRYWDEAGARLRTRDQLLPAEQEEAKSAPRLRIHGDACSEIGSAVTYSGNGIIAPVPAAQFNWSGDIKLFLRNWIVQDMTPTRWLTVVCTIAHEAGHAIGLDHVVDNNAIMSVNGAARADLADADLQEHARVWP